MIHQSRPLLLLFTLLQNQLLFSNAALGEHGQDTGKQHGPHGQQGRDRRESALGMLRGDSGATPSQGKRDGALSGPWSDIADGVGRLAQDGAQVEAEGLSRQLQGSTNRRSSSTGVSCEMLYPDDDAMIYPITGPVEGDLECCWEIAHTQGSTITMSFRKADFAEGDTLLVESTGSSNPSIEYDGQELLEDESPFEVGEYDHDVFEFSSDVTITLTVTNASASRMIVICLERVEDKISTTVLFNSTLILLGFVWCGVTFARLVCVHRARENAIHGAHFAPDRRGSRGGGATVGGVSLGAATSSGPPGLTPAQIQGLELTTEIPARRRFGSKLQAVGGGRDLERGWGGLKGAEPPLGDTSTGPPAPKAEGLSGWGEEEATCAICLCEEEGGQSLRVLPCGHFFHSECVDVWLAQSATCPFCKQDVELPPPAGGERKRGGGGSGSGGLLRSSAASVRSQWRWLRHPERGGPSGVGVSPGAAAAAATAAATGANAHGGSGNGHGFRGRDNWARGGGIALPTTPPTAASGLEGSTAARHSLDDRDSEPASDDASYGVFVIGERQGGVPSPATESAVPTPRQTANIVPPSLQTAPAPSLVGSAHVAADDQRGSDRAADVGRRSEGETVDAPVEGAATREMPQAAAAAAAALEADGAAGSVDASPASAGAPQAAEQATPGVE